MNEEKSLMVGQKSALAVNVLTPQVWTMLTQIGPVIYESRMYKGISSPQAAIAVMMKGYELGLGMSTSFEFIQAIQNKYELIPRGALALMHGSPFIKSIEVKRLANGDVFVGYECTIVRTNGFSHTSRFTLEDANRAGLVKPDSGWMKYPENMCMWRAIGFCADVAATDVIGGMTNLMKMPEQYGVSLDNQGNVIDGNFTVQTGVNAPVPSMAAPSAQPMSLDKLLNQYGADGVSVGVQVFLDGKIPQTQDQINFLAEKLAEMQ